MDIAILGGGPSGLFMFKRLVDANQSNLNITIFERKNRLGAGMPYSDEGANQEHITNVSGNEIPQLVTPLHDWVKTISKDTLLKYNIDAERFNEYKVLPRLLFGQYLEAQFSLLQKLAKEKGIIFTIHYNTEVNDIADIPEEGKVNVVTNNGDRFTFDHVIISTGHNWPKRQEGKVPNFFDSPYPPSKLCIDINHPVAIRGSSLTAVDALRTLARNNGSFKRDAEGNLSYEIAEGKSGFKIVLHTRHGMLPAVRFHLDDPHLRNDDLLSREDIKKHISENGGFLSLDFIFEQDFKLPIRTKDPAFYGKIKDMQLEDFVEKMLSAREKISAFQLLRAEYREAEKSIRRRESVYWKEMLGVLSFALNYPAKYLSAEDMERLHKSLLPLIAIVIAYIPQSSAEELMALHQAAVLDIVAVGADSSVEPHPESGAIYHYTDDEGHMKNIHYKTYIDCTGQPHLPIGDFPFKSLLEDRTITAARLKFRSADAGQKSMDAGRPVIRDSNGDYYLQVSGIAINDNFQVVDAYGAANERIYLMAVPYIGGFNPDYSGLDFCEEASGKIVKRIFL
jgi:uncharacterized NAD(P)/FAD-binding protein YdhS